MVNDKGNLIVYVGIGHGGEDPGAVANGLIEKDVNLVMGRGIYDSLGEYGVERYISRTTDKSMSIDEKIKDAKKHKATLVLDTHNNAGGGDGMEVLHSIHTEGLGDELALYLVREIDRLDLQNVRKVYSKAGTKDINSDYFGMIRQAQKFGATGLILEGFFLDNVTDIKDFDTTEEQYQFGKEIGRMIAEFYGYSKILKKEELVVDKWKSEIFEEAVKLGLITDKSWKSKLDESAPIWFVLSVAINILKKVVK